MNRMKSSSHMLSYMSQKHNVAYARKAPVALCENKVVLYHNLAKKSSKFSNTHALRAMYSGADILAERFLVSLLLSGCVANNRLERGRYESAPCVIPTRISVISRASAWQFEQAGDATPRIYNLMEEANVL